jgi:hypothetical protein
MTSFPTKRVVLEEEQGMSSKTMADKQWQPFH